LAFAVQRYGEVDGGAEYHCRLVAEHLARGHDVEVFTTCARDYLTWRNQLPPGRSEVSGIPVHRFRVRRPRDPERFGRLSERVFRSAHDERDELEWLKEQGPFAPSLVRALVRSRTTFDYFVFFSYRYYHSYHGVQALADRALLVPTAEKDDVIRLGLFRHFFNRPRAIVYNSVEEREMIVDATSNEAVPGDVVGVGAAVPQRVSGEHFRRAYGVEGPYLLFIGRIDPNKGCRELFNYFARYRGETDTRLQLVLVGGKNMDIPTDPAIRHAGFLSESDKWNALAGAALLVMPSALESLSMVTLEAWALGIPVLANGRCDVLRGQCRRSNAGLYYNSYYEFGEALSLLARNQELRAALGRNGRRYFHQHYRWEVVEEKYNRLLSRLVDEDRASARTPSLPKERPSPAGTAGRSLWSLFAGRARRAFHASEPGARTE
jgi:glycosyltransferase involved in cell wall biosynthesis